MCVLVGIGVRHVRQEGDGPAPRRLALATTLDSVLQVAGVLDCKNDNTSTTAMITEELLSNSDTESDDGEGLTADNLPGLPLKYLLYGGDGEFNALRQDVAQMDDGGGQTSSSRRVIQRIKHRPKLVQRGVKGLAYNTSSP